MDRDLQRFIDAQNGGESFIRALAELRTGRKTSHWMWFVFPQIAGLGQSEMSRRYAIESLEEARAYRAAESASPSKPAHSTGFDGLGATEVFEAVLERYFEGEADAATERLL